MISVFMSAWSFYSSGLRGDNQWLKPALVFATSSCRMFQTFLFHCFCFVCFFSSVAVLTPGYKSHYPSLRNRKHRNLTVWGFYRIFHLVILWHAGTSPMIGSKRLTSLTVIRVQGFFCSTTELCHLLPNDAELNVYLAFFTDALTWKQSNSALSFSLSPLTVWGKTDWSASAFIYLITLSFVCTAWLNLSFHCQPGLVEHTHTHKKKRLLCIICLLFYIGVKIWGWNHLKEELTERPIFTPQEQKLDQNTLQTYCVGLSSGVFNSFLVMSTLYPSHWGCRKAFKSTSDFLSLISFD